MKMSKHANLFWRLIWAFCLAANFTSWISQWAMIGNADSYEQAKTSIYVWMPLAGFLTIYSLFRFMELNREAHREVEEPTS